MLPTTKLGRMLLASVRLSRYSGLGDTATTATSSVTSGGAASFTVIPDFGYARSTSVGGDCPQGSWIGDTYTTGEVSKSCFVEFNFHYIY